jgi:hemerythrin-like domain-containing protein
MVTAGEAYRLRGHEGIRWAKAARRYADVMRRHICREEQVLFGNAQKILEPAETEALAREFEHIDARAHRAGLTEILDRFERAAWELRK